MGSTRIAWTRISTTLDRCTATTWLAEGVTEAVTVTDVETAEALHAVEREAADTDESLILVIIIPTKARCVGYTVHLRTPYTIYSVAVLRVHDYSSTSTHRRDLLIRNILVLKWPLDNNTYYGESGLYMVFGAELYQKRTL